LDSLINDCSVLDIDEQSTHHYAAITVELRQAGKPSPFKDAVDQVIYVGKVRSLRNRDNNRKTPGDFSR
jgi:hypothetical protein